MKKVKALCFYISCNLYHGFRFSDHEWFGRAGCPLPVLVCYGPYVHQTDDKSTSIMCTLQGRTIRTPVACWRLTDTYQKMRTKFILFFSFLVGARDGSYNLWDNTYIKWSLTIHSRCCILSVTVVYAKTRSVNLAWMDVHLGSPNQVGCICLWNSMILQLMETVACGQLYYTFIRTGGDGPLQ